MSGQLDDLLDDLTLVNESRATHVEWRVDYFNTFDPSEISRVAVEISKHSKKPLIGTLRTSGEGGRAEVTPAQYLELIEVLATHLPIVDIEFRSPGYREAVSLVRSLRQSVAGVTPPTSCNAIASYHDFSTTPDIFELRNLLDAMTATNPDVVKIAVTPQDFSDVLRLMQLANEWDGPQPLIAISMTELGQVTRVFGPAMGSCASFASVRDVSAPGQLAVNALAQMWDVLNLWG